MLGPGHSLDVLGWEPGPNLWLVQSDHVTWILSSDWSRVITWPEPGPTSDAAHYPISEQGVINGTINSEEILLSKVTIKLEQISLISMMELNFFNFLKWISPQIYKIALPSSSVWQISIKLIKGQFWNFLPSYLERKMKSFLALSFIAFFSTEKL